MKFHDTHIANHLFYPHIRNKDIYTYIDHILGVRANSPEQALSSLWDIDQTIEESGEKIFALDTAFVDVLVGMETEWIRLDVSRMSELEDELTAKLEIVEKEIFAQAPAPFNIQSPKQLSKMLFEDMDIIPIKKTKTGWSTDESTLQALSEEHPICSGILAYRHLSKLLGTYVKALPKHVHPSTGKIHTSFSQVTTSTGRLSSDSPNLQNIPSGDEYADRIKACFVPSESDRVLLVADYSQVELRILACVSNDENLLDSYRSDIDIHSRTAQAMFGRDVEITSNMRTQAKAVNFSVMYGVTGFGLSKMLGILPKDAQMYIDAFYEQYPKVREYFDILLDGARKTGYVETFFGRRRYVPAINDANKMAQQSGAREAMNMPIQWTNADIMKYAMLAINQQIADKELQSRLVLQIHDELVLDVCRDELDTMKTIVRDAMEWVVEWRIPLSVQMGVGNNWSEAK